MIRRALLALTAIGVAGVSALWYQRVRRSPDAEDARAYYVTDSGRTVYQPTVQDLDPAGSGTVEPPAKPVPSYLNLGLGAWAVAVVVAFAAQRELTPLHAITPGALLYAVASILAVVGATLIDRGAPLADPMLCQRPIAVTKTKGHGTGRTRTGAALMAVGGLLVGAAVYRLAETESSAVVLPAWLLGMFLFTVGLGFRTSFPWKLDLSRQELIELGGVLALIALAFAFRFPALVGIPADVHGDEAAVGIDARGILSGEAKNLFGLGWSSLPELSFVASSLSMRIFGNDLFGLRMASVIQGSLSVGLLYGVVKRLFSGRVAVLSAIVLAVSQMAIHYGRIGNNYIQALFASLLVAFFLLRGLSTGHPMEFLVAGFSAGLALNVYYPSRLTLGLVFLYCLHRVIGQRDFLRRYWRGLVVLLVGAGLFFAPEAVWYAHDPMSALNRTSGVFVLRPDNLAHEYGAYNVHSVAAMLRDQFVNSIEAFNLRGETSMQYGQTAPLLDFWSGALFVLGAVLVTVRPRNARYFLLASWLWLTILVGSVLTVDAMFSPRMVAILAATAILPCLVVETGWRGLAARFGAWGNRFGMLLALVFVTVVARANYVDYFVIHARTMEPASFFTVLSHYAETVNGQYRIYLLANNDTSLRYDTAHFLIPDVDGVDVRGWPLPMPLDRIPSQKGVVFVDPSENDPRFQAIRAEYPRGVLEQHRSSNDSPQFYSYRVEHADLEAANPHAVIDHAPIPALNLNQLPKPT